MTRELLFPAEAAPLCPVSWLRHSVGPAKDAFVVEAEIEKWREYERKEEVKWSSTGLMG